MELTKEKEEQLQQDIMTHLDSCPEDLINELCQVIVDYKNIKIKQARFYMEKITMPEDIILDLAKTLQLIANHCNCNDGNAESVGLDWNYLHKLNSRTQHWLDEIHDSSKYIDSWEAAERRTKCI